MKANPKVINFLNDIWKVIEKHACELTLVEINGSLFQINTEVYNFNTNPANDHLKPKANKTDDAVTGEAEVINFLERNKFDIEPKEPA